MYRQKCTKLLLHLVMINKMMIFFSHIFHFSFQFTSMVALLLIIVTQCLLELQFKPVEVRDLYHFRTERKDERFMKVSLIFWSKLIQ